MDITVYCLAPGCKNNSKVTQGRDPAVVYHRIKDDLKWHRFCSLNRKDKFPQRLCERPEFGLCSTHFKPEDYENYGERILFEDAFPSQPTPFEELNDMCYLCFSSSSANNLIPFDLDVLQELDGINLGFVKANKIPKKLCETCHLDINRIVTYLNRVKSANKFWQKFGLNIGVVNPVFKRRNNENDVDGTLEPTWKCQQCDFMTIGKDPLFKHVWLRHAVNKADPNTCKYCNKTLASEHYNSLHYLKHHYEGIKDEQTVCSECGFLAKTNVHLNWHLKHSHDIVNERLRCEWCIMSFVTQDRLDLHMEQKHSERIQPPTQGKIDTEAAPIAKYEITMLNDDTNNDGLDENSTPMDHDMADEDDWPDEDDMPLKVKKEREMTVETPGEQSSLLTEYKPERKKRPIRNNWKPRPSKQDDVVHKCPDCDVEISGKTSMASGGLRRHYWVRHGRIPETPNICRSCNKTYKTEHLCRIHYFGKHFDSSFFCEICGKTGMTKNQLSIHTLHSHKKRENKTFTVCRFCNRKYDSIEKMQEHEKSHENDGVSRPFVCNECGKCYSNSMTLQNHMKLHMGIRNHKCQYCDMTFVVRSNMKIHELTHTRLAPFRCSLCEREFIQLGHIQTHIQKKHGPYDKEIMNKELIIRQNGKGTKRGKRSLKKEEVNEGEEKVHVEYITDDFYEASNSLSSL